MKRIIIYVFDYLMRIIYYISPKLCMKTIYFVKYRKKLNLKNPKTFNEKLNWIKLNIKDKLLVTCADKYSVRDYLSSIGLTCILTNLLWVGDNPKNIPFDNLPNSYVIKVSKGSKGNIIVKDATKINKKEIVKNIERMLKIKYKPHYGEWFYLEGKNRILIEEFLIDENSLDKTMIPLDYKFFCFRNKSGCSKVEVIAVDINRFTDHKRLLYDTSWHRIRNHMINFPDDPNVLVDKPEKLDKMIKIAEKISKEFPHCRVDLYYVNEKIYFGEITFISDAGFGLILPKEYSYKLGSKIYLHSKEIIDEY